MRGRLVLPIESPYGPSGRLHADQWNNDAHPWKSWNKPNYDNKTDEGQWREEDAPPWKSWTTPN